MIVVAVIGLLAAIAIPNVLHARTVAQTNTCIDNLRMIDSGKQQWALESGAMATTVPVTSNIQPYLLRGSSGELPLCPLDPQQSFATSYSLNDCQTSPTCLINPVAHVLP